MIHDETKHTSLPWHFDESLQIKQVHGATGVYYLAYVWDEDDNQIAEVLGDTSEQAIANAKLIVRAYNCHYDLLETLQNFVDYYTQAGIGECNKEAEDNPPDGFDGDEVFNVRFAQVAIAKTKGNGMPNENNG